MNNMHEVEITMEKTMRITKTFRVTTEQLDLLKCGVNPFEGEMDAEIESGTVEHDYAVNDIDGNEIVPWAG